MDRRVLVTGATGFIGRRVTNTLAKEGWSVRAAARDPGAILVPTSIERVAMRDLVQPADWSKLLDGVTHVVHLAGIAEKDLGRMPIEHSEPENRAKQSEREQSDGCLYRA